MFGLMEYQEIFILTLALTLLTSVIHKRFTRQNVLKKIKDDLTFYKERMKSAQKSGDIKTANEMMKAMLSLNKKYFMASMKPMIISLVIFTVVLFAFGIIYAEAVIKLPINIPLLGNELNWFWWYFMVAIPFSMIFRKLLDVK